MKIRKVIALAAAMFVASQAGATTINGSGLQNGLNGITVGGDFRDVTRTFEGMDQRFELANGPIAGTQILFEFAGFRNANSFGIYDIYNPDTRLEIYSGPESAGQIDVFIGAGNIFTVGLLGGFDSAAFESHRFGFYLDGPQGPFFSETALNNGYDQMVAYRGNGSETIAPDGIPREFNSGAYILAFEDLRLPGGDRDYSDFVVLVEGIVGVPAPAPLALLGLGLIGLGFARKRA